MYKFINKLEHDKKINTSKKINNFVRETCWERIFLEPWKKKKDNNVFFGKTLTKNENKIRSSDERGRERGKNTYIDLQCSPIKYPPVSELQLQTLERNISQLEQGQAIFVSQIDFAKNTTDFWWLQKSTGKKIKITISFSRDFFEV